MRRVFFLKADVVDHAADAVIADLKAALTELLGDDFGGGVRVQEPVTDDLPDKLVGSAVVPLGPSRGAF